MTLAPMVTFNLQATLLRELIFQDLRAKVFKAWDSCIIKTSPDLLNSFNEKDKHSKLQP